jgi:capping protein alpha
MSAYVADRYAEGGAAAAVYCSAAAPGELQVVVSGEKVNLRNFWSGQFASTWAVTLGPEATAVAGEVKVRAHYFEEGNVQLQTKKTLPAVPLKVAGGGSSSAAAAVAEHIAAEERLLQVCVGGCWRGVGARVWVGAARCAPFSNEVAFFSRGQLWARIC